ncbi:nucleoside triphosphate pyrophosphohydrolase family protein [Sporosarcina trichiuri]|uniref:nucleoside triphosphate pyrophosphohydrolase family protein n=1 Tax=Sporosarcina trichiuri TaxID=3056445 RepID=UPI0025B5D6EF|nr:nucleoside triphosphate pyrophosphohydrolase family protein [Sporosarcina sp. 0.2-SM1T-5]WJY27439.1 nucleoside triphosphate pyrophosphohydrolase family protein [Sporosarcina sp. 0.2-SM1T-5]WJY27459.1 nucleoside triphosphate pyrophosphohydrolase family protein [Sporosarcina sp. 0.2-SM1T-5]
MELNEYQRQSARTAQEHDLEQLNYALGIAGEAGEVADLIKKRFFHGHTTSSEELKKELGDVLWYLAQISRIFGITLEEVAEGNIEKLQHRYPDGFSETRSIGRTE